MRITFSVVGSYREQHKLRSGSRGLVHRFEPTSVFKERSLGLRLMAREKCASTVGSVPDCALAAIGISQHAYAVAVFFKTT